MQVPSNRCPMHHFLNILFHKTQTFLNNYRNTNYYCWSHLLFHDPTIPFGRSTKILVSIITQDVKTSKWQQMMFANLLYKTSKRCFLKLLFLTPYTLREEIFARKYFCGINFADFRPIHEIKLRDIWFFLSLRMRVKMGEMFVWKLLNFLKWYYRKKLGSGSITIKTFRLYSGQHPYTNRSYYNELLKTFFFVWILFFLDFSILIHCLIT